MKLTLTAKASLILIGLGLLVFVSGAIWLKTIRTTVIDIPMPTEKASRDFTVDHDAIYSMWVRFDHSVSLSTAKCLLGGRTSELHPDLDCGNTAPLLRFSWELRRDGQSGGVGSSADMGSTSTEDNAMSVLIVSFPAQKKHRYTLSLKPDQNAKDGQIPSPRVRIDLDIFNREDFIIAWAALDFIAVVLCLIGVVMFCVPLLKVKFGYPKTPTQ